MGTKRRSSLGPGLQVDPEVTAEAIDTPPSPRPIRRGFSRVRQPVRAARFADPLGHGPVQ